jgi:UDP-N-acetylmuramate dehydrogenase
MSLAPAILMLMNILHSVSLTDYSTMRLGGTAAHAVEVHSKADLTEAVAWAEQQKLPIMMIGSGSNIIWRDEGYAGLLITNKLLEFEMSAEDELNVSFTIGAGENWDSVVARTVAAGATGIEALSLIPGTAGGTPVQNVGAYGQEIADTLVSVEAYDVTTKEFVTIAAADCGFGYRTSRFKTTDKGRFLITSLTLHLTYGNPQPPFYASVQQYFDDHGITDITPKTLRDAVVDIRSHKLPNSAKVANNGSFFANPIVSAEQFAKISADYSNVPHWETKDGRIKIPAAWLIEQAGFKDVHDAETGMGTWPSQPLVLMNEHATSTAQLLAFRQKILDAVMTKFGVTLEQEPELLP